MLNPYHPQSHSKALRVGLLAVLTAFAVAISGSVAASAAQAAEFPAAWQAPQGMTVQSGSPYHRYYRGTFEDDRWAVDFSDGCRRGIPVVAPFTGSVTRANWTARGNQVIVSADNVRLYVGLAHLDRMTVSPGQRVTQGQQVGTVGNTGRYAGSCPHIHMAAWSSTGDATGMPITRLSGQAVNAGARITGQQPVASGFGPLTAYAAPTIGVTAGDHSSFVVVSRYHGTPLECGWVNLRIRGDGSAPREFIDAPNGWWPNSHWVSPGGVKVNGCNGQLHDGETAQFHVPVKVPLVQRPGTYSLGTFSPVYDRPDGHGFWSGAATPLAVRVGSPWGALNFVGQSITPQVEPGGRERITVSLRNGTGYRITPDMGVNLATGGPNMPTDAPTAAGFNRLLLHEPCEADAVCDWSNEASTSDSAQTSRRRIEWHIVVEGRYHADWTDTAGIWVIEKVGRSPEAMAPGLEEVDFRLVGQKEVSGPPGSRQLGELAVRAEGWGCVSTDATTAHPMHLGVPGDQPGPYLDRDDPRVIGTGNRVAVPGSTGSMVCAGDTVTIPVPVKIPDNAEPGSLLKQPLSEVTEETEWDGTMLAQRVWLPIRVTEPGA